MHYFHKTEHDGLKLLDELSENKELPKITQKILVNTMAVNNYKIKDKSLLEKVMVKVDHDVAADIVLKLNVNVDTKKYV